MPADMINTCVRTSDLPPQLIDWQERRWLDSQQRHSERRATRLLLSTCACTVACHTVNSTCNTGDQKVFSCHWVVGIIMLSCCGAPSICVLLPICTAVPALIRSIKCSCESHTTDICMHKMPPQNYSWHLVFGIILQLGGDHAVADHECNLLLSHVSYAHSAKFIHPFWCVLHGLKG